MVARSKRSTDSVSNGSVRLAAPFVLVSPPADPNETEPYLYDTVPPATPGVFWPPTESEPPPAVVMPTMGKLLAPKDSRVWLTLSHFTTQPCAVRLSV